MKAEHIHEALDLLPEDLIEKVDRLRSGKAHSPNRLYKNLSAIAACLALLILGSFAIGTLSGGWGGSAESADMAMSENAAAPEIFGETGAAASNQATASEESSFNDQEAAQPETARFVCTDLGESPAGQSSVAVIRSRQELEEFCSNLRLSTALSYDDAYFSENALIFADLGQGSSSVSHSVLGIVPAGDHAWELQIKQTVPDNATRDRVLWHMLLDVDKDLIQPGDSITLSLINEEE